MGPTFMGDRKGGISPKDKMSRINTRQWVDGSEGQMGQWVDGSVGQMGQWVNGSVGQMGQWVDGSVRQMGQ